ncbi:MAG: hypothetical protein KBF57_01690 [Saprospiraceae bacterium]|nr:hypothetical protein [Saprospiraceae bacterium]MBP9193366.1 hypothetical protein [Saprospiraceae bacterium]
MKGLCCKIRSTLSSIAEKTTIFHEGIFVKNLLTPRHGSFVNNDFTGAINKTGHGRGIDVGLQTN